MQFMTKALFVRGFQEPRAERAVHFDRGADYTLRECFMKKFAPCLRVSVVNHVCKTPTLNSATSGFNAAASSACVIAFRVSAGSIILSIHSRAAP
jgi:hypothetical protein